MKEAAKKEASEELAMATVAQAALLERIQRVERQYKAGVISHTKLVAETQEIMDRQRFLNGKMERIYK